MIAFKNKIVIFRSEETWFDRLILLFNPRFRRIGYFITEKSFVEHRFLLGASLSRLNPELHSDVQLFEYQEQIAIDPDTMTERALKFLSVKWSNYLFYSGAEFINSLSRVGGISIGRSGAVTVNVVMKSDVFQKVKLNV